ncbi:hypothetical protein C476_03543 [Natrinema limicola JCM 13563]|uniref:Uncharacterized protein n=1 Tax=Natrinema limicola JCM 13563 TaxID=1230457 RepID=M0CN81_9EURY|nr:hypothetical protein C476_03543 [Natrinema limicola JCM 13563]
MTVRVFLLERGVFSVVRFVFDVLSALFFVLSLAGFLFFLGQFVLVARLLGVGLFVLELDVASVLLFAGRLAFVGVVGHADPDRA